MKTNSSEQMENLSPSYQETDEIDLLEIFNVLKEYKKLILLVVIFGTFTSGLVSIFLTPIYSAKAVISPVVPPSGSPGLSGLASQLGISLNPPPQVTDIVALLKSNLLREKVVKKYGLIPYFIENPLRKEKSEDEIIWDILRSLENSLKVKYQQRENLIEITFEHKDKAFTARFLENLLYELNEHLVSEEKRVATANKEYLLKEVEKTGDPYVRSNIYSLIAKQIERSMMAEAKENFAFKIIDPPKVPDKKAKPKRLMITLVSFFVSLFSGVILAFCLNYFRRLKEKKSSN